MAPISATRTATVSSSDAVSVLVSVNVSSVPSIGPPPADRTVTLGWSFAGMVTVCEPIAAAPCVASTTTVSTSSREVSSTARSVAVTAFSPFGRVSE